MPDFKTPVDRNKLLLTLIKHEDSIHIQNVLMRIPDYEIALALLYFHEEQVDQVLKYVSGSKATRILDEIERNRRVRITEQQFAAAFQKLVDEIKGERSNTSLKRYFRPLSRKR